LILVDGEIRRVDSKEVALLSISHVDP